MYKNITIGALNGMHYKLSKQISNNTEWVTVCNGWEEYKGLIKGIMIDFKESVPEAELYEELTSLRFNVTKVESVFKKRTIDDIITNVDTYFQGNDIDIIKSSDDLIIRPKVANKGVFVSAVLQHMAEIKLQVDYAICFGMNCMDNSVYECMDECFERAKLFAINPCSYYTVNVGEFETKARYTIVSIELVWKWLYANIK